MTLLLAADLTNESGQAITECRQGKQRRLLQVPFFDVQTAMCRIRERDYRVQEETVVVQLVIALRHRRHVTHHHVDSECFVAVFVYQFQQAAEADSELAGVWQVNQLLQIAEQHFLIAQDLVRSHVTTRRHFLRVGFRWIMIERTVSLLPA